nr:cyclic nucleotide-binding domain-containing protein [Desulfobulbaceae bacterium]
MIRIQQLINDQSLSHFLETYSESKPVFLEGDDSKDIFILIHGSLKLLKNKKQIGEIYRSGELFGEMSYLLDTNRTASVVAQTETRLLKIPEDSIPEFLRKYSEVSQEIIHTLAQRLKDTTQVAHGLKEFCDQLPDAVVMTDTSNKIMAWNKAAEILHGRVWQEMKGQSVSDVFQNPEEYRQFIEDVQAGKHLTEKILLIRCPDGDERYVSTSTTVIYDGHFNIAGYIFLSRNVTNLVRLEEKYRKLKHIFLPTFAVLASLLVVLSVGLSNFSKGIQILDHKKQSFQNRITNDYKLLYSDISPILPIEDRSQVQKTIERYFKKTHPEQFSINGILVLNNLKLVTHGYTANAPKNDVSVNTHYSGINFTGDKKKNFKILNLYRTGADGAQGSKETELAIEIKNNNNEISNWIVFQLDMESLEKEFGITQKMLYKMTFN